MLWKRWGWWYFFACASVKVLTSRYAKAAWCHAILGLLQIVPNEILERENSTLPEGSWSAIDQKPRCLF